MTLVDTPFTLFYGDYANFLGGDLEKRGRVRKNWTVEGGGGGNKYLNEPYPPRSAKTRLLQGYMLIYLLMK